MASTPGRLFLRFFTYIRRYWGLALKGGLTMGAVTALSLAIPMISKFIMDDALLKKDAVLLFKLIGLWFGAEVVRLGLGYLQSYYLLIFRIRTLFDVRFDLFQHVQRLPLEYFHRIKPGYLASRIFQDVGRLAPILGDNLLLVIQNLLMFLVGIGIVYWLNPRLALLVTLLGPLYLLNHRFFARRIREYSRMDQENWAKVLGGLHENLVSIETVKLFGREVREAIKYLRTSRRAIRHSIRFGLFSNLGRLTVSLFFKCGPLLYLAYAGWLIVQGRMTLGDLMAFSVYMGLLFGPIRGVFQFWLGAQAGVAALERIYEILDRPTEFRADDREKEALPDFAGGIAMRDLSFRYAPEGPAIFQDASMEIRPGEVVLLVGGNGSGKTTLVNLILGFFEPGGGEILFDGRPSRDVSKAALRKRIGVVSRDSFFFNASIRENVAYGKRGATEEELWRALEGARAVEFVRELPRGIETPLGEKGAGLSRGQLQRIALARVLLKDPVLLILDEGTASIDQRSLGLIWETLGTLKGRKTIVVISHDQPAPPGVSAVFELVDGRIRRRPAGTHPDARREEV
jgi:ABC-type multidrug transport system fused ATPase/permease subunit